MASVHGKKEAGWIVFSADYLQTIVAQALGQHSELAAIAREPAWMEKELPQQIRIALLPYQPLQGFAVLEGVTRAVWAMPQRMMKPDRRKNLRPLAVDVVERM